VSGQALAKKRGFLRLNPKGEPRQARRMNRTAIARQLRRRELADPGGATEEILAVLRMGRA